MTPGRGLLLCCLAVGATATLAACSSAAPAASPAASYDKVIAQVYGTPAQRRAADARAWWTSRLAAVECMRRAGHVYGIVGYNPPSDREHVIPGDLLAFAPAGQDLDVADQLVRAADARLVLDSEGRSVANDNGSTDVDRVAAARRCESEVAVAAGPRVPDGQQALAAQLVDRLRHVQDATAPTLAADYGRCMAAADIPAADLATLRTRVERAFPATLAAVEYDPTKLPGWAQAVAFEHRAAAADAGCREAAVTTVRAAAAPQLVEFARQHAAELDRVAAGWTWIEADARNAEYAAMPED
ncbi:hypothetical protein ACTOB_003741 [Actinoplanes oblitus]|uniref:Uncharacterized protein n=1 Tax=Actinoplanes oblitus TaxID=3040509 RepID=A0ABY8WQ91_9ACTN|nr:hypothetical protein [Actinoplanes oblitus]WIN00062.1 hypothetical protein ACTOB_003741 [Actinoplanes oblitus]